MPHEIDRILAIAKSHVWLIDEQKAQEIAAFLALRADGHGTSWAGADHKPVYALDPVPGRRGPVHVLRLHGTIFPRAGMLSRMSGGATMEQFQRAFAQAAADTTAQAIVLDVDSPGGIVDLVPETAAMIYGARRAGRPIVAVANTMMASAAYFLGSAADEIVVSPSGIVGSIGVYTMHDDISERLKQLGVNRTVIKSGARKAEGAHGPLDKAALAHIQAGTDYAYGQFAQAVAKHRGVSVSVVRADPEADDAHFGGGRAYHAKDAVRLGMADRIDTLENTIARLAGGSRTRRVSTARARLNLS